MDLMLLLQEFKLGSENQQLRQQVEQHINHLISTDFNGLVQLLYTVDVDEQKLKTTLQQEPLQNAATLITDLIFARLHEKAASRQQAKPPDSTDE